MDVGVALGQAELHQLSLHLLLVGLVLHHAVLRPDGGLTANLVHPDEVSHTSLTT